MGMMNDRWLRRRADAIAAIRKDHDGSALSPQDRLIEVVWLMSRSMRSTGDLAAARTSDPTYLADALAMATRLRLPVAMTAFAATEGGLERSFFDLIDLLCSELQQL